MEDLLGRSGGEPLHDRTDSVAQSAVQGQVLSVVEEQLAVATRVQPTGVVRLQKHNEARTETVEVPLTASTWNVEHVLVNRIVGEVPPVRQEGDTTIYPVMEERLIVTRQLVLREEVHITRTTTVTTNKSTHVLLHEVVDVTREQV